MSIHAITMPQLGLEMTEGEVSAWHVREGDAVTRGMPLVDIETSKIVNEIEAEIEGTVRRLIGEIGVTVPVGTLIAVIADVDEPQSEIDRFILAHGGQPIPAPSVAIEPKAAQPTETSTAGARMVHEVETREAAATNVETADAQAARSPDAASGPVLVREDADPDCGASPIAVRVAKQLGVDIATVKGSGRRGRVLVEDVERAADALGKRRSQQPSLALSDAASIAALNARAHASPVARRFANRQGIDLTPLRGSGRGGRVALVDVHIAAGVENAPNPVTVSKSAPPASVAVLSTLRAGPSARKLAAELGVDLASAKPTGPRNLILKDDVVRAAQPGTAAVNAAEGEFELLPHSAMRRSIAENLVRAKQTIPHFYLTVELEVDRLLTLRKDMNEQSKAAAADRPSINDFFLRATALALVDVPEANVQYTEEGMRRFTAAHLCVAIAIEGGLLTPVVRNADDKSILAIAREVGALKAAAGARRLKPEQLAGGTFTVSNLGMFGIHQFDAIVNPPQAGILAVGAVRRKPFEAEGGTVEFRSVLTVTLSCDHRAIDGAVGACFLAALRTRVERPHSLLC